jgi:hypothetical protein
VVIQSLLRANWQLGKPICSRIVSGKICFSLRNQRHHTTVSLVLDTLN